MGNPGSKDSETDEFESDVGTCDNAALVRGSDHSDEEDLECVHPRPSRTPKWKSFTAASNDYTHDQLGRGDIRIFDVLRRDPAFPKDVIQINIREAWIPTRKRKEWFPGRQSKEQEVYCSLSYAWSAIHADGSHLSRTMLDNGAEIKVTENLYQALLHIRHLWDRWYNEKIDATTLFCDEFACRQRDSKKIITAQA